VGLKTVFLKILISPGLLFQLLPGGGQTCRADKITFGMRS
jgi:hypothetical protein